MRISYGNTIVRQKYPYYGGLRAWAISRFVRLDSVHVYPYLFVFVRRFRESSLNPDKGLGA